MAIVETEAPERLMTIEEYAQLPDNGAATELVRGRVITLSRPSTWHGIACGNLDFIMGGFVRQNELGYSAINDAGIITEQDPDTLRGADYAFYSYKRVPKGTAAKRDYLTVAPDVAVEVKSPNDSWRDILTKVVEYLNVGVSVVCVLDPERSTVTVYRPDQPERTYTADEELTLPDVLPGFSVAVRRFFE